MPRWPWARAYSPSWMYPPFKSAFTSQCAASILPVPATARMHSRIMSALCTPRPSSEKAATEPASAAMSAISSPRSPTVSAP